MTDPNSFKIEDTALVLVDHQVGTISWAGELSGTERLQSILDSQVLNPAHIIDDAFTVVAWNALAERFYGFRNEASGFERNVIWRSFNEAAFAAFFSDWDDTVSNLVGLLRYNYARAADDSDYEALVHELYRTKPVFRRLWDTYHVDRRQTEVCRFHHALVGDAALTLQHGARRAAAPPRLLDAGRGCVQGSAGTARPNGRSPIAVSLS